MIITSAQNPLIKATADLREARARKKSGLMLIDGVREINRALKAGVNITQAFVCPKLFTNRGEAELLAQLTKLKIEIIEVNEAVFGKLGFGERQEGLLTVAVIPKRMLNELSLSKKPLVVIVEAVEKPGNLGAIMRTADAVGADALIVCDQKTDIYNPNVIRASTGVVFNLPVVAASAQETLDFLRARKIKVCATLVEAKQNYTQADLSGAVAIVLGTEDQGLSDFWAKNADIKVNIPMRGVADSLNVSTSAAIILYESLRQRQS